MKTAIPEDHPIRAWPLRRAARALAAGGVIAHATEAVYGLACDPLNRDAVLRLLVLKRRSPGKGLILIAAGFGQLDAFVRFPSTRLREQVLATWPGPVSWVLPARPWVPSWLTGGRADLAVRVTAHPQARALCSLAGPLVSSSANPSACAPARDPQRVRAYFGARLDYLLPGRLGAEPGPSRIFHALTGERLR